MSRMSLTATDRRLTLCREARDFRQCLNEIALCQVNDKIRDRYIQGNQKSRDFYTCS